MDNEEEWNGVGGGRDKKSGRSSCGWLVHNASAGMYCSNFVRLEAVNQHDGMRRMGRTSMEVESSVSLLVSLPRLFRVLLHLASNAWIHTLTHLSLSLVPL